MATGEKYVSEAKTSARSLKNHNDIPVTLVTNESVSCQLFDEVIPFKSPQFNQGDSIPQYEYLTYDKVLFLDVDTYICGNISDVFEPLQYYDIGCAFNIGIGSEYKNIESKCSETIPPSFYEYNTGVIVMRKCKSVKKLLSRWRNSYDKQNLTSRNQPSFRRVLYQSDIRHFTLSRNYNYRLPKLAEISGPVKIIHGRHPEDYTKVSDIINKTHKNRVIIKKGWPMKVITCEDKSIRWRMSMWVSRYGFLKTFHKLLRRIWATITKRRR